MSADIPTPASHPSTDPSQAQHDEPGERSDLKAALGERLQELVALAPVRIKLRLTRIKQLGRALQRKLEARLGEIAGSGFRHEEYKLFVA